MGCWLAGRNSLLYSTAAAGPPIMGAVLQGRHTHEVQCRPPCRTAEHTPGRRAPPDPAPQPCRQPAGPPSASQQGRSRSLTSGSPTPCRPAHTPPQPSTGRSRLRALRHATAQPPHPVTTAGPAHACREAQSPAASAGRLGSTGGRRVTKGSGGVDAHAADGPHEPHQQQDGRRHRQGPQLAPAPARVGAVSCTPSWLRAALRALPSLPPGT